jgi:hypothetical protein
MADELTRRESASAQPSGSRGRTAWHRCVVTGTLALGLGLGTWGAGAVVVAGPAGASIQPRDVAGVQSGFAGDLVTRANDERNARTLPSLNTNAKLMSDAAALSASFVGTSPNAPTVTSNCPGPAVPPAGTSCEMSFSFAESGNNPTDGSDGVDSQLMADAAYRRVMLAAGNADIGVGVTCANSEAFVSEVFGFVQGTDQTLNGYVAANTPPANPPPTPVVAGTGVGNPWFCPGEQFDQQGDTTTTGGQITIAGNSVLPTPTPPPNNFVNPPPPPVVVSGGALTPPVTGMAATPTGAGYWLVNSLGGVSPHGDAGNFGSMAGIRLNAPISHIVSTPDGKGYWLVASDGGTFAFGDAGFFGSMGGRALNKPVVNMAPTPDGAGYWLVASDGGIFAFGDATFLGSMGGKPLNKPVVGMAPDDATGGYWLVASDGGIFAFHAPFLGSTGALHLRQPVIGMAVTFDDGGYWLNASDGGVFSFGDAQFLGSTGGSQLSAPIVDLAADSATGGYWQVDSKGTVYAYQAQFFGSD